MPADAMVSAIKGNNLAALTRIPGIGKKTAERMVLELRDKLDAFGAAAVAPPVSPVEEDVISAMVNLGYQRGAVEKALAQLGKTSEDSFDALFRKALAALAK
jgi:Holliday junction DNA helicase RuvA